MTALGQRITRIVFETSVGPQECKTLADGELFYNTRYQDVQRATFYLEAGLPGYPTELNPSFSLERNLEIRLEKLKPAKLVQKKP